ncbi:hypothetical protein JCM5296_003237, partial [Sporobolomyces johnsonii]
MPQQPTPEPETLNSSHSQSDLSDSSESSSATTTPRTSARQPSPTMSDQYPKSTSTPVTSYTTLLRDRLEAVGHLAPSNWDKWSSLAADIAGGMMGVDFAISYLDGTIEYPGYEEKDYRAIIVDTARAPSLAAWSRLARILKEVVEEYGGEEAASKVRHLETKMGNAPAIWNVLVEAYQRTRSGSERMTLFSQLANAQYDEETTSPAAFSSVLLHLRRQYNAAARHDAEKATNKEDPDVIADLNAAISLSTLRNVFQNAMPEAFAQHLESGPPPPISTTSPSPSPRASSPASTESTSKPKKSTRYVAPKFAATKYANHTNWRGGLRIKDGITLFKTPVDSCLLCFKPGHFARECHSRNDKTRQARSRVAELAKDGIKVPEAEATALFVSEPGPVEGEEEQEEATARVVQGEVRTSFERDEEILRAYFTSSAFLTTSTQLPPIAAPPLSSLPKPTTPVDDYIIDSGVNNHYTTRLDHLHGYTPFPTPRRIGGAFSALGFAYGSGSLIFNLPGGRIRITDVNYVPLLTVNLLSHTTLMLRGIKFTNDRKTLTLSEENGNKLVDLEVARTIYLRVLPTSPVGQGLMLSSGMVGQVTPVPTQKGARFAYAMIDDATRMMWVKPLKTKGEVAEVTAARIRREERQTGDKVANFRSDRGGEFTSTSLEEFFKRTGIRHETTIAYEHAQNGLIERQWCSLFETVRCWLHRSGLPLSFWDLAVVAAVHVKNLLPTEANEGNKSPYEAFYGTAPDVSHLRVWGCRVDVRLPLPASKLHPRAVPGRFVGYLPDSKGYLVWVPEKRRLVEAWSVVFHEDEFENVRSPREETGLDRWMEELDWVGPQGLPPREEEGRKEAQDHPTTTQQPLLDVASPNRFTPLANDDATPPPPPQQPAPPPKSQDCPLTRAERRRQGTKLTHFVPLAGAPKEPEDAEPQEVEETFHDAQEDVPTPPQPTPDAAIALTVFANADSLAPLPLRHSHPRRDLLAYAVYDPSLDGDHSQVEELTV